MLVFMVTKDDFDRYGIWKTFIGSKQPSLTQMLEFGKWAVFKPVGLLMQATIIDFNTEDDALESSESIEISSQFPQIGARGNETVTSAQRNAPPPPPPAPPPPPMPAVGVDLDGNSNEPKCKKLSWKELKVDLQDTVWERINQQISALENIIDKNEILELFKEKPRKSRKFSAQTPNTVVSETVQTITGKKQLNISIALAHHQLSADNLFNAVNHVDIRLLEADFLSTLESFLPDQNEENSLMQKFSSTTFDINSDVLMDPEQFSYLLSSVPEFRKKIRAMVFQCSFHDRVNAICNNLDVVRDAAREILHSERFEKALLYTLSLGRKINNSATKAFNIDFLSSASCFKSSDGDTNFLMYLAHKLALNDPDVLCLAEELPSLQQAVKVSLNDIDRDSTELAVEYGSIALELDSIIEESKAFKEFLRQGKFDLNHLKRKRRQVQQELKDLAMYFGIDPVKSKPMEIFSTLKQFIKDLATANEKVTKKAASRKNSSRAMIRSASTPNFKRGSRNSSFRGSRNSSAKSSRNSSARSSFRRVFRSISVASTASDATTDSQDGKAGDVVVFDIQRSRSSLRSPTSAMNSFNVERSCETPLSTLPKSYQNGYANGVVSSTPKRSRHLSESETERPREPDLSKYRDLMKQLENEKRKANMSQDTRSELKNESSARKNGKQSLARDESRKVMLSPVRERSRKKNDLAPGRGYTVDFEAFKSKVSDQGKYQDKMRSTDVDYVVKTVKTQPKENYFDDIQAQRRKEANQCTEMHDERRIISRSTMLDGIEAKDEELATRNGHENENRVRDNTPNSTKYRNLMNGKETNLEEMNGKGKELKTLHCRIKLGQNKQRYAKEDGELQMDFHQKCTQRSKKQRSLLSQREGIGMLKYDALQNNGWMAGDLEDVSQDSYRIKAENCEKEKDVNSNSSNLINGNEEIGDVKEKFIEIQFDEKEINAKSVSRQLEKEYPKQITKCHEKNASDDISKSVAESSKNFLNKSNSVKNFPRGGSRNSITRNRGSFRGSFRSERGIRKVSIKAFQAKDVQKVIATTKSEPRLKGMGSLGRRSKSANVQAVIMKPGLIAGKEMLMRSQKENANVMNGNDVTKNQTDANGNDLVHDDECVLREGEKPVLRRTKSATISRNIREAKIIFFL